MQETWVQSLGWEDPLEEGMAIPSHILAWRIPWTEELVGYSPKGCTGWTWLKQLSTHTCMREQWRWLFKNNCQVSSLEDREHNAFHTVSSCPLFNAPKILGFSPSCLYSGLSFYVRYFCFLFPSTLSISSILFYLTPTQLSVSYISISVLLGSLLWI